MNRMILVTGLCLSFAACDDDSGGDDTEAGTDMDFAGVCNPPCSPGFVCTAERVCVREGELPDPDDGVPPPADMGGACDDRCEAGGVRCSGDAIESCVDTDGDGCVEWGEPIACAEGLTCSAGLCSDPNECTDDCNEGDVRCGAAGVQECRADADGDPCLDWAPEEVCPEGETCSNGACAAGGCDDECGEGTSRCAPGGNGRQDCGNFDGDDCFEWSDVRNCGEGQSCSNGVCTLVEDCSDECAEGTAQCTDGSLARVACGNSDADECLELGAPMRCGAGEICSGGECQLADMCEDECAEGARRCAMGGFQACAAVGGCMLWGALAACAIEEGCVDGQCVLNPVDECPGEGAVRCEGDAVVSCGYFDADAALDWSQPRPCGQDETCSNGVCDAIDQCQNECDEPGVLRCQGGGIQQCDDFDADDCLDWGRILPCGQGESCNDGVCDLVEACVNECELGDAECGPGGVRGCGDFDVDDCLDWSAPTPCADNEACMGGACIPNNVEDQPGDLEFIDPPAGSILQGEVQLTLSALDADGIASLRITSGDDIIAELEGAGVVFAQWGTEGHADGPVTLLATLVDEAGNETRAERDFVVDNDAPVVEITSPEADGTVGQPFDFTARVDDAGGVQRVRFLVNNNEVGQRDEAPWTIEIDPGDHRPPGPKTLEVVATDVAGHEGRAQIEVEFAPDDLTLRPLSPDAAMEAARPFIFAVEADGPDGVASVELLIDGERLALVNAPPFQVEVDPADYDGDEHQLEARARDDEGREALLALGVRWDRTPPDVQLVRPAPGGLVTREGDTFVVEVEVDDADPEVHVEVLVGDEVIGEVRGDPYEIDARLDGFDPEVHEVDVDVTVRGTDYLGNVSQREVTLRFSRADLAVTADAFAASMVSVHQDHVLMGIFDELHNEGRVLWIGPEGSGPPVWDVNIGTLRPIQGFFYDNNGNAGVLAEDVNLNRRGFLRINSDGEIAWSSDDGVVREARVNNDGVTYLLVERPGEWAVVARDSNGDQLFEYISDDRRPERIEVLANGDVLVSASDDDNGLDELRRFSSDGEEQWVFDVDAPISRLMVAGNMILIARDDGEGENSAIRIVRISDGGLQMWASPMPNNVLVQSLKLRGDGAPLVFGQNLHVFQTYLHCFDPDDGDELFNFEPPGFIVSDMTPFQRDRTAVAANDMRVGEAGAAIFQLQAGGMVASTFETDAETVLNLATRGDSAVVVLNDGNTGRSALLVLDPDGEIVWREDLDAGVGTVALHVPAERMADLVAFRAATGTGVLFPYGPDGTYDWRVEAEGAIISQVASLPTHLVVAIETDGGVDVLRLPRE